jgi:hypothetical protein
MMPFTAESRKRLHRALFSNVYLGLIHGTNEISGDGYRRVRLILCEPEKDTMTNTETIDFPEARASWGEVNRFGLWDAETGGSLVFWGNWDAVERISADQWPRIKPGRIEIKIP